MAMHVWTELSMHALHTCARRQEGIHLLKVVSVLSPSIQIAKKFSTVHMICMVSSAEKYLKPAQLIVISVSFSDTECLFIN